MVRYRRDKVLPSGKVYNNTITSNIYNGVTSPAVAHLDCFLYCDSSKNSQLFHDRFSSKYKEKFDGVLVEEE